MVRCGKRQSHTHLDGGEVQRVKVVLASLPSLALHTRRQCAVDDLLILLVLLNLQGKRDQLRFFHFFFCIFQPRSKATQVTIFYLFCIVLFNREVNRYELQFFHFFVNLNLESTRHKLQVFHPFCISQPGIKVNSNT